MLYSIVMKTAISIPSDIFESAEKLAGRLGKSRSQLYTQAISSFLAKHQSDNLTHKLNEIYGVEASRLDADLVKLQSKSLPKDEW